MSELATEMIHVLKEELVAENETWRCFSFPSPQVEGDHHEVFVKVKLSTANDATRLSSHGWRVWPGAQILSQWLVSWERNLSGMKVLEAWICRWIFSQKDTEKTRKESTFCNIPMTRWHFEILDLLAVTSCLFLIFWGIEWDFSHVSRKIQSTVVVTESLR